VANRVHPASGAGAGEQESNKLVCSKRVKTIRVGGLVTELDLERVAGEDPYDRPDLARRETEFGHVREECYGVEKLNW